MKIKKFVILAFLAAVIFPIFGAAEDQSPFSFNISFKVGSPSPWSYDFNTPQYQDGAGFIALSGELGLDVNYRLDDSLMLSLGVYYQKMGFEFNVTCEEGATPAQCTEPIGDYFEDRSFKAQAIKFPLAMQLGRDYFVKGGIYLAFLLGDVNGSNSITGVSGVLKEEFINRSDYGLLLSAGLKVYGPLNFSVFYNHGLVNIIDKVGSGSMKNRLFMMALDLHLDILN